MDPTQIKCLFVHFFNFPYIIIFSHYSCNVKANRKDKNIEYCHYVTSFFAVTIHYCIKMFSINEILGY